MANLVIGIKMLRRQERKRRVERMELRKRDLEGTVE